jgi:hypothetical protein
MNDVGTIDLYFQSMLKLPRLKRTVSKSAVRQGTEIEHFLISDNKPMLGTYQPPTRIREGNIHKSDAISVGLLLTF